MFLIRDSTSSANDYVVSVTHNGKVYHFQIKEIYKGHYQIDEGPIVHGKGDNQDKWVSEWSLFDAIKVCKI